jgi:hypothetical protein
MVKGLNEKLAAERIGKKPQTLRNWRHLRKGPPYIRIGRSIVYLESDLREYMEKHRIDPEQLI